MADQLDRHLFCCDGLHLLEHLPSACVGLLYLDPPALPAATDDVAVQQVNEELHRFGRVAQQAKRILTDTGNLALYTTPDHSPYFRLILDDVLGMRNFRNEIVIPRTAHYGGRPGYVGEDDRILLYGRSDDSLYNQLFQQVDESESRATYPYSDGGGRYRLEAMIVNVTRPTLRYEWRDWQPPANSSWRFSSETMARLESEGRIAFQSGKGPRLKVYEGDRVGKPLGNVWSDVSATPKSLKSEGVPTEQSVAVLERLILIATNPRDLVIDPYCGSGTTFVAAETVSRRWIGSDNDPEACKISAGRLSESKQEVSARPSAEIRELFPEKWVEYVPTRSPFDHRVSSPSYPAIAYDTLMTPSLIRNLLRHPESEVLEFKRLQDFKDDDGKAELLKDLVAFANTRRSGIGCMLIGVDHRDGSIARAVGIEKSLKPSDIEQFVNSKTNRQIIFRYDEVEYEGIRLGVFRVDKEQPRPIFLRTRFRSTLENVVYVRNHSTTTSVTPDELLEWAKQHTVPRDDLIDRTDATSNTARE